MGNPVNSGITHMIVFVCALGVPAVKAMSWEDAPKVADGARDDARAPAEERRLGTVIFRAGLKKRGLTELLKLHLADYPPNDPTAVLRLRWELKLEEAKRPTLSTDARLAVLAEANRILERIIALSDNSLERMQWRMQLARSLLYDEGEPFSTSILYRGGSDDDRRGLLRLASRAVALLVPLEQELAAEQERLEHLPLAQFERYERNGHVETVDRLAPQVDYLLKWARFYDALPRAEDDADRARQLNLIRDALPDDDPLLTTPHDVTHFQVQGLLLAGMTCRLLNDHSCARRHLERAVAVAGRIGDQSERQSLQWARRLAAVERVRNERDAGRFDASLGALNDLRSMMAAGGDDPFAMLLVAALLERSAYKARSVELERNGRSAEARQDRREAWRALERLARRRPAYRDEVYATVFDLIGTNADPVTLDPFERLALVAGLLFNTGKAASADDANAMLDQAIAAGELFLTNPQRDTESLAPEVLFNTGAALYRRGRGLEAAARFLQAGRDFPSFDSAERALVLTIEVAAEVDLDASPGRLADVRTLRLQALNLLVTRYPRTEAARYWRFYYGQALEDAGQYDEAAIQYSLVDSSHAYQLESMFLRVRCLAMAVTDMALVRPENAVEIRRRVDECVDLHREFSAGVAGASGYHWDAARSNLIESMQAEAVVIMAELQLLDTINQPARALRALDRFEATHREARRFMGRVLRVRLLAFERLGRIDEATEAIPAYVASDPKNAAATLQLLYVSMVAAVDRLRGGGDDATAQKKADAAVAVAETIAELAAPGNGLLVEQSQSRQVQLAEAYMMARRFADARVLLERCIAGPDGTGEPAESKDLRAVYALAEARFQSGEFAEALPLFNRLAVSIAPENTTRWKALLRDLQCRMELGHDPAGVIKVIAQQRELYKDLGGSALTARFEKLERDSRRRQDERGD